MKEATEYVELYFIAERTESVVFIVVGSIALIISLYFLLKLKQPLYSGAAYALFAVALVQLSVGTSVYMRSPKDIERVSGFIVNHSARIQSEEIPRMQVVMKNFDLYRWIEMSLVVVGWILCFVSQPDTVWKGVGYGLSLQASLMLLFDFFAERRGQEYVDFLMSRSS